MHPSHVGLENIKTRGLYLLPSQLIDWRISKSDLEMVQSLSLALIRLEGPTRPPKVAKGSGSSSTPSELVALSLSVPDMI